MKQNGAAIRDAHPAVMRENLNYHLVRSFNCSQKTMQDYQNEAFNLPVFFLRSK